MSQDLRVEEVPVPEIGADELLIKVQAASICGTDLRIFTVITACMHRAQ